MFYIISLVESIKRIFLQMTLGFSDWCIKFQYAKYSSKCLYFYISNILYYLIEWVTEIEYVSIIDQ